MNIIYKGFRISSKCKGTKKANWESDVENENSHVIVITDRETRKTAQFSFWASMMQLSIKTEHDLLNAFYCFVSDAIGGGMDFHEFCLEFGYDEDSRTAETVWKACKRSARSLERIYNGDIYELCNELAEVAA